MKICRKFVIGSRQIKNINMRILEYQNHSIPPVQPQKTTGQTPETTNPLLENVKSTYAASKKTLKISKIPEITKRHRERTKDVESMLFDVECPSYRSLMHVPESCLNITPKYKV